jgi:long-chain acyl-CoA synthetase
MNLTGASEVSLKEGLERLKTLAVPELFAEKVAAAPDVAAIRFKREGVFHELTWPEYRERVRAAAAGLVSVGVAPGDRVAIMGDVCIEYLLADLGVTMIGAIACGIYPTSSPHEVGHVMGLAGARVFIAEDQEHLDRLLDAEELSGRPLAERIVVCDGRALFLYDDPRIMRFPELLEAGADRANAGRALAYETAVTGATQSAIIFTSGTSGNPKGAYRTQSADLIGFGHAFLEALPELRARPHRVVCQLPLAHGMGRAIAIYVPLMAAVLPHLGEQNQSLPALMNEVRPSYVMGVPRTWEKLVGHVQVNVEGAGFLARKMFSLANAVARKRLNKIWRTGRPRASWWLELAYWPLWAGVLWPALHKVGLTYARGAVSGGAAVPAVIHETLGGWGLPLRDMFGMTETGGIGAQRGVWPASDAPIYPVSSCEVRLGADGELLLRGLGNISGYWRDEAASAALIDDHGFVHTGDIATLDNQGSFRIVDRKKDILITSGGKNIAPAAVENALRSSSYISEVIVFGDQRKFITAVIEIDFENVSQWARQNEIPYTGYLNLAQNRRVVALIRTEVERLNQQLARVEQVKKFVILPKELVPEDGDTTPTRKVKRASTYNRFKDLIEGMYAEDLVPESVGP